MSYCCAVRAVFTARALLRVGAWTRIARFSGGCTASRDILALEQRYRSAFPLHLDRVLRSTMPTRWAASIAVRHLSMPARAPPHPSRPASRTPPLPPPAHTGSDSCRGRRGRETRWVCRRAGASATIGDEASARARASWRRSRSSAAGSSGRAARLGEAAASRMAWTFAGL